MKKIFQHGMPYLRDYFSDMWGALRRLPLRIYEQIGWQGILAMICVAAWLGYLTSHAH